MNCSAFMLSSVVIGSLALRLAPSVRADIVIDLDPMTPGIQTTLSVLPGASVTAITYFDPTLSGPLPINGFGIDLNWTATGAATATPSTPPMAGSIAPFGPGVADLVTATSPIFPGMPLASAGVPPFSGPASIGGVGLVDLTATFFGAGGPIGTAVDLFGVTFTIAGAPGDTVTFIPSGILVPALGATAGVGPFVPGGAHYQAGVGSPSPTTADAAFSSVVTIIPEPGVALYTWLGLALMGRRIIRLSAA